MPPDPWSARSRRATSDGRGRGVARRHRHRRLPRRPRGARAWSGSSPAEASTTGRARSSAGCSTSRTCSSTTSWPPWRRTPGGWAPRAGSSTSPCWSTVWPPSSEQGITIDVAYRFFATDRKKFIVADTPGHEQYTRNMVTGASNADAAVILVDARKGVLTQTRRHSYLVALLGIEHVILAVNKLDLVGYRQADFDRIEAEYRAFASGLGLTDVTAVPISALRGVERRRARSRTRPGTGGRRSSTALEQIDVEDRQARAPFRMPVQWVNRPDLGLPGLLGPHRGWLGAAGDAGPGAAVGSGHHGAADLDVRRGPRGGGGRAVGHPRPRRRGRRQPRRPAVRRRPAGRGGRPVRGPGRLDARGRAAARAPLPGEGGPVPGRRHLLPAQVQGERRHAWSTSPPGPWS